MENQNRSRNQFKPGVPVKSGRPIHPNIWQKLATSGQWNQVVSYLSRLTVVRKHICAGCGTAQLYDNNRKLYPVNRNMTLEQVESIVDEIKKINAGIIQPD